MSLAKCLRILIRKNVIARLSLNLNVKRSLVLNSRIAQQADANANTAASSNTDAFLNYKDNATEIFGSSPIDNNLLSSRTLDHEKKSMQYSDHKLWMMDSDVKRFGRTDPAILNQYLDLVKEKGSISAPAVLTILNACGMHMPMLPCGKRIELLDNTWKLLTDLGFTFDVSHYNTLLAGYLENFHEFSPFDFLKQLENDKIEPNRITFQRLMKRFSQMADLNGVSTILEFMKSLDIPVGESICNILLYANIKAKNETELKAVMSFMHDNDIELSRESHFEIMCGYAEDNNLKDVLKILDQNLDANFTDGQILHLIYLFARNSNTEPIESLLMRVRKAPGYLHTAMNSAMNVNSTGAVTAAVSILATVHNEFTTVNTEGHGYGRPLLAQSIQLNFSDEKLTDLCRMISQKGINKHIFELAYTTAVEASRKDLALSMMEELIKINPKLLAGRPHCFWPLMIMTSRENDTVGLTRVSNMARDTSAVLDTESWAEWAWPNLIRHRSVPVDLEGDLTLIDEVKQYFQHGSMRTIQFATVSYLAFMANQRNVEAVKRLTQNVEDIFITPYLFDRLALYVKNTLDFKTVTSMVARKATDTWVSNDLRAKFINDFVLHMIRLIPREHRSQFIDELYEQKVALPMLACDRLKGAMEHMNDTSKNDNLDELCKMFSVLPLATQTREPHQSADSDLPSILEMDMKDYRQRIMRQRNAQSHSDIRLLLRNKMLDEAIQFVKCMEMSASFISAHTFVQLTTSCAQDNRLLDAFEYFKKAYKRKLPSFIVPALNNIELMLLLLENDHVTEMLTCAEIWGASFKNTTPHDNPDHERSQSYFADVLTNRDIYLLENVLITTFENVVNEKSLSKQKISAEDALKMVEHLFDAKVLTIHPKALTSSIQMLCKKNEVDLTKQLFEIVATRTKVFTASMDLIKLMINSNDVKKLQEVYNVMVAQMGENRATLRLAISLAFCGKIKEANKLMAVQTVKIGSQLWNKEIDFAYKHSDTETLEAMLHISKNVGSVRDNIYQSLLKIRRPRQEEKAAELWTRMQEENLVPSEELQQILNKMNLTDTKPFETETGNQRTSSALLNLLKSTKVPERKTSD